MRGINHSGTILYNPCRTKACGTLNTTINFSGGQNKRFFLNRQFDIPNTTPTRMFPLKSTTVWKNQFVRNQRKIFLHQWIKRTTNRNLDRVRPLFAVVSTANPLQRTVFRGLSLWPLPCLIAPKSANEDADTKAFIGGPSPFEISGRIQGSSVS
jgi:hypothetical protein